MQLEELAEKTTNLKFKVFNFLINIDYKILILKFLKFKTNRFKYDSKKLKNKFWF